MTYSAEFLDSVRKNYAPTPFTEDRQRRFLENYAETGLKHRSAWAVGVHPSAVKHLERRDPEFAQAVADAKQEFIDTLEKKIELRAASSDRILEMMAKRHIPEYREKVQVEGHTKVTGEVQVHHKLEIKDLSPEQLTAVKMLLEAPAPKVIEHQSTPEEDEENAA